MENSQSGETIQITRNNGRNYALRSAKMLRARPAANSYDPPGVPYLQCPQEHPHRGHRGAPIRARRVAAMQVERVDGTADVAVLEGYPGLVLRMPASVVVENTAAIRDA